MSTHVLKTDPKPYDFVAANLKKCELRFNDRNFKVGDKLILRKTKYSATEMAGKMGKNLIYTGDTQEKYITHILDDPSYGLKKGWVILSIK